MELSVIQHLGTRESQQDAYFAIRGQTSAGEVVAMGVADGVGGLPGGAHASRVAVGNFTRRMLAFITGSRHTPGVFRVKFEQACRETTKDLAWDAQRQPELAGAATTITACAIINSRLFAGNLGDSPLIISGEHETWLASKEHSQAAELRSKGVLTAEEYQASPFRGTLTKFLSTSEQTSKEPAYVSFTLEERARVVLCSDGVLEAVGTNALTHALACRCIHVMHRALDHAIRANATDNATLVCFGADKPELPLELTDADFEPAIL